MSAPKVDVLSLDEVDALRAVAEGADVYAYGIARHLRSVQKKRPSYIRIGRAKHRPPGEEQQPYFGAIATDGGKRFIQRIDGAA